MSEPTLLFKGTAPCGCVTWLYSGKHSTPKQREKDIADALRDGLRVEPIRTQAEKDEANQAWGSCPHRPPTMKVKDALEKARTLLASEPASSASA